MRGLAGKAAIVTGGATIIGRAVVRELHAGGMSVAIADIDAENGEPLAAELGERALFVRTDITDDAQVEACVAATVERFGRIDVLVNLACSYLDEGIASPRADWLAALDVNVVSAAMMARAGIPTSSPRVAVRSSTSRRSRRRSPRRAAGSIRSRRPRSSS